jgi:hypothetical protein
MSCQVGVLLSHVHSIVMSSNGMEGELPAALEQLPQLRMIELATMPGMLLQLFCDMCDGTWLPTLLLLIYW